MAARSEGETDAAREGTHVTDEAAPTARVSVKSTRVKARAWMEERERERSEGRKEGRKERGRESKRGRSDGATSRSSDSFPFPTPAAAADACNAHHRTHLSQKLHQHRGIAGKSGNGVSDEERMRESQGCMIQINIFSLTAAS